MPNPLSEYGLSDADYAMTVGMAMGEAMNEGLVGMGLVAATGLNRAQNPGAYLARTAALGDVFAAPYDAQAMMGATFAGRSLPGAGRQFSPTFNSNIPGASTEGHKNFKTGMAAAFAAAIDPTFSPDLGIRMEGFERAKKATEIAVKARDMGVDLGFGVTNFGAPGYGAKAGVGRNPARFGGHMLGPFDINETAPTASDFAARFAAAAALTGVEIPDDMVSDITTHVGQGEIMSAASIMQRQAQDYLSDQLGEQVFPGLNYNDQVQPTGFRSVDVLDVTGQLGIDPTGAQGFANTFGITPTNDYEETGLPSPVGRVDFGGYLDAPASYDIPGFSVPDTAPVDISGVDQYGPTMAELGISNYAPSGYHSGFDGWEAPQAMGPHMSEFDFKTADDISNLQGSIDRLGSALADNEALMGDYNNRVANSQALQSFEASPFGVRDQGLEEINPTNAFGFNGPQAPGTAWGESAPQLATPSVDTQSMYAGDWADKIGVQRDTSASPWSEAGLPGSYAPHDYAGMIGGFSMPQAADLPAYDATPAKASTAGLVGWDDKTGVTIGGYRSPSEALGLSSSLSAPSGFMDAMANPDIAKGYQSGWSLGPIGMTGTGQLTVGGFKSPVDALGSLFGEKPQTQPVARPRGLSLGTVFGGFDLGGLFGGGGNGLGDAMVPNGTGGWRAADILDAMSNPDIASRVKGGSFFDGLFGGGGLFGGSEGYYGGGTNGPGSSRGDGSYAESAGYSSNNPQGIL